MKNKQRKQKNTICLAKKIAFENQIKYSAITVTEAKGKAFFGIFHNLQYFF